MTEQNMSAKSLLAGVVVLYNPTEEVKDNISSYIEGIDKLYIIDNSSTRNEHLFREMLKLEKVEYIFQSGNLGIANALNKGCKEAMSIGAKWILTMDQDSKFLPMQFSFLSYIESASAKVGIIYPTYLVDGFVYDKFVKRDGNNLVTMTSGNVLNLGVYDNIGPFRDDFFIDYVDIEYCLRLQSLGYKLFQAKEIKLVHGLGEALHRKILGKKITITNHNYVRRYYITRNRFYVIKKYKEIYADFTRIERMVFLNDLLKIIFFESDKMRKLRCIWKGYLDYKENKFGEYKA